MRKKLDHEFEYVICGDNFLCEQLGTQTVMITFTQDEERAKEIVNGLRQPLIPKDLEKWGKYQNVFYGKEKAEDCWWNNGTN